MIWRRPSIIFWNKGEKQMAKLRGFTFEVFLWLSVVVYSSMMLLVGRVSPHQVLRLGQQWERVALWGLKHLCKISFRVTGQEHLKLDAGQIILSNHQSTWETIALGIILPQPQTWVLKRELLVIPFFGWALRLFNPIAIERSAGRDAMRQILKVGTSRLAERHTIVIFPEGTRVAPERHKRFAPGGAVLAARTGAPVVPIAHNAGCFWPKLGFAKYPGIIDVVIGPPIDDPGLSVDAINAHAEAWVRATLRALPRMDRQRAQYARNAVDAHH